MQELFNLFYLYDYMTKHTTKEKYREYCSPSLCSQTDRGNGD